MTLIMSKGTDFMKDQHPLFATRRTAAALLDMKPSEFEKLVNAGHLPRPIEIGGELKRWDVQQLRSVVTGSLALGEELKW